MVHPSTSKGRQDDASRQDGGGLRQWWESLTSTRDPGEESLARGHEPEGSASARNIVGFAAGLLLLILAVMAALVGLERLYQEPPAEDAAPYVQVPPAPQLQMDPAVDLYDLYQDQRTWLHSYGVVDAEQGVAHIPITHAFDLIAEQGLPFGTAALDSTATAFPDTVLLLTSSGYVRTFLGAPAPTSPPVLGASPEPYVPNATVRRLLPDPDRRDTLDAPSPHR